jgi:hypothetical protein
MYVVTTVHRDGPKIDGFFGRRRQRTTMTTRKRGGLFGSHRSAFRCAAVATRVEVTGRVTEVPARIDLASPRITEIVEPAVQRSRSTSGIRAASCSGISAALDLEP